MHACHYPGCNKQFDRKYNLKCHLRIHSDEKPYRCHHENCSRSFRWKSSLNHHLMSLDHASVAARRERKARAAKRRQEQQSYLRQEEAAKRMRMMNSVGNDILPLRSPESMPVQQQQQQQQQQHHHHQQQQQQQQHHGVLGRSWTARTTVHSFHTMPLVGAGGGGEGVVQGGMPLQVGLNGQSDLGVGHAEEFLRPLEKTGLCDFRHSAIDTAVGSFNNSNNGNSRLHSQDLSTGASIGASISPPAGMGGGTAQQQPQPLQTGLDARYTGPHRPVVRGQHHRPPLGHVGTQGFHSLNQETADMLRPRDVASIDHALESSLEPLAPIHLLSRDKLEGGSGSGARDQLAPIVSVTSSVDGRKEVQKTQAAGLHKPLVSIFEDSSPGSLLNAIPPALDPLFQSCNLETHPSSLI